MFGKRKGLPENMPKHISFIIDGNGRWAQKRGLPRNYGHKIGMKAVEKTIENLVEFKVPYASFYCFSSENWKRSKEEIDGICDICRDYFKKEKEYFMKKNIKVLAFGDTSKFPNDLQEELASVLDSTKDNTGLTVMLCIGYGGRDDVVRAVNKLIASGKKTVTEEDISNNLYTAGIPDPDFVVRTSGENRISNYMIYQVAYSELYFPKVLWPDFDRKALIEAFWQYSKRKRRFGGYGK